MSRKKLTNRLDQLFSELAPQSGEVPPGELRQAAPPADKPAAPRPPGRPPAAKSADAPPALPQPEPTTARSAELTPAQMAVPVELADAGSSLLLEFLDEGSRRVWSDDERILVEQVASQLTLALENARLFERNLQLLKEAEQDRRRYLDLYNRAPDCYFSIDPQGYFIEFNQTGLNWLGFSREEVVGQLHMTEIMAPESRQIFYDLFPRLIQDGRLENVQVHFTRKDGMAIPVLVDATAIYAADGTFEQCRSIARDITHLRQLEQQQRQLVRAIESTDDAVVVTNRDGEIQFVNPAFQRVTGYTPGEVIGQNTRILRSGQQGREYYQAMWTTILSGQPWRGDVINRRKDGSQYNAQLSISPILDEYGLVAQFVAVQRDVTDQKLADLERERLLQETESLYQASARFNAATSYQQILDGLRAYSLLGQPAISNITLNLFDTPWTSEQRPVWITPLARWSKQPYARPPLSRYPLADWTTVEELLHPQQIVVISDPAADPRLDDTARSVYLDRYQARTLLFAPINIAGNWVGHLIAIFDAPAAFSEADRRRLLTLIGQAASAVESLRLLDETRRRNDELTAINTIIGSASRSLDLQAMLQQVLNTVLEVLGFDAGLVSIYDEAARRLRLVAHQAMPDPLIAWAEANSLDGSLCDTVYRAGAALHIPDLASGSPEEAALTQMGLQAYLGVPLAAKGKILGTICSFSHRATQVPPETIQLMESIGQQVAVAVENSLLFSQTQAALAETSALYQAGAELNAARSNDEIVMALRRNSALGVDTQSVIDLVYFDHPWSSESPPTSLTLLARTGNLSELTNSKRAVPFHQLEWTGRRLRPDKPLYLEDATLASDLDDITRRWLSSTGVRCLLVLPLVVAGQWRGYVGAYFRQPRRFTAEELRRMLALASQAAVAVQNLQSLALAQRRALEAQKRSEELVLINRVVGSVAASLDLSGSLQVVATELGKALNVQTGIALLNESETALRVVSSYTPLENAPNVIGFDIPLEGNLSTQQVVRTRRSLVIDDPQTNPLTASIKGLMEQRGVFSLLIVPIIAGSRVFGTVGLDILQKDRVFSPDEIRLAETIVTQAANAVQNAQLFAQTQAALTDAEQLYAAGGELNASKSYADILTALRSYTLLSKASSLVSINIFDHHWTEESPAGWYTPVARWSPQTSLLYEPDLRLPVQELPAAAQLLHASRLTLIPDIQNEPGLDETAREKLIFTYQARSLILAPLVVSGEWIGFLLASSSSPARASDQETRRLTALLGQAAAGIQNIRLLQETTKRAEQLQTAAEVARESVGTLALGELLNRAVELICARFGYSHASLFLVDETGASARVLAATGPAGEEMIRRKHRLAVGSKSVIGYVTQAGKPLVVNDVIQDSIHRPNPLLPATRSELGIPLMINEKVIGALDVQSNQINAFKPDDVSALQILADQLAVAVDNARAFELSQQAMEEMRKADQLKSQFLANMSHELRTPLNSILGFSRVILKGIDGPITDLQQQDLTAIYNSGQHLLNLITDILDLSKIEAGKMEMNFEENIHLGDLIQSVIPTATGLVKDRPIQLIRNLSPDLPTVRADSTRIRQVLINLLSNAAKFTEEGSITIEAGVEPDPAGNPEIVVRVTDTGMGIALEDQALLFQPFSQVDASPSRKVGGSGLGLSICRHLIEMHGGRVGVVSEQGHGSSFYFTLPVRANRPFTTPDQPLPVILAVDSERQVLQMYERYLNNNGFHVIGTSDSVRALEFVRQVHPQAITLDLLLPGGDGWKVLRDLKKDPALRQIPVIVCTILEEEAAARAAGADDYLMKPILEADLVQAVRKVLAAGEPFPPARPASPAD